MSGNQIRKANRTKPSKTPTRTKRWCFTLNNPNEDEKKKLSHAVTWFTYIVVGNETGDSGTPHFQGYFELDRRRTLTYVKTIPGLERAHFEGALGTAEENTKYCTKDGDIFIKKGTAMNQGKRTDLEEIGEEIKNGATLKDICDNHFSDFIRYHAGFKAAIKLNEERDVKSDFKLEDFSIPALSNTDQKAQIVWGESGVGKTMYALAHFKTPLMCSHIEDLLMLNPKKHDGIVFDDMSFTHMPRTAQIHLVDMAFTRTIHVRYGTVRLPARFPRIFTTNELGGRCLDLMDPAISRRVTCTQVTADCHAPV